MEKKDMTNANNNTSLEASSPSSGEPGVCEEKIAKSGMQESSATSTSSLLTCTPRSSSSTPQPSRNNFSAISSILSSTEEQGSLQSLTQETKQQTSVGLPEATRSSSKTPIPRSIPPETQTSNNCGSHTASTFRTPVSGEHFKTPDTIHSVHSTMDGPKKLPKKSIGAALDRNLRVESTGVNSSSAPASTAPITSPEPSPQDPSFHRAELKEALGTNWVARSGRSSSRTPRRFSASTGASSISELEYKSPSVGKIGVCALDIKARSKPSQNILTRLQSNGEFEVIVFGDKVILDEDVENWPQCDFLIAFFSDGFPLDKAISYAKLRQPFCINDLPMQQILWDRRLCLRILDQMGVPTPKRVEVNRDGGPRLASPELAQHVYNLTGVRLEGPDDGTGGGTALTQTVSMSEDGESLIVDGKVFRKPFVEKPVSGEDHNIHIYFPDDQHYGGGGRRLFRKIGNKSSEYDPELKLPRSITEPNGSYLYEQFLRVDNAEDVKAYTVGPDFCHAETRKSPVVDGVVRRNTHGKELRYITKLTQEEATMATKISNGFCQRICGFDLLRVGEHSYVIDVNGWSFVKDNNDYYDKCAKILRDMFIKEKQRRDGVLEPPEPQSSETTSPQKSISGSHRAALKNLLKSPSMLGLHSLGHKSLIPTDGTTEHQSPPSRFDLSPASGKTTKGTTPVDRTPSPASGAITKESGPSSSTTNSHPPSKHSWKLKGMVAVIRHADRTPKQKFKFTFHTQPFVDLLKGHQEEIVIKGETALRSVSDAVELAMKQKVEDPDKLKLLQTSLRQKGGWPGTKVQIKPMFRKRKADEMRSRTEVATPGTEQPPANTSSSNVAVTPDGQAERVIRPVGRSDSMSGPTFSRFSAVENDLVLDKLQLVIKWGGEPTHAARYQSQDVGLNMRDDLKLMNKECLNDVRMFTSSERRVSTSAQIFATAFLDLKELPEDFIQVRKDLLDDSNAAKDVMDKVKKKLKLLLREGNSAPPQFAWPKENFPEPSVVLSTVVELMKFHRSVMRHNFRRIEEATKVPETESESKGDSLNLSVIQGRWCAGEDSQLFKERWEKLFKEFCDTEKVDPSKLSELYDSMKFDALHNRQFLEWVFLPPDDFVYEEEGHAGLMQPLGSIEDSYDSYFKLYPGSTPSKPKIDKRLSRLRQLYSLAKVLFDFVTPQEYGIDDEEKLEIGLLTSLPLLREIVMDLEEVQASPEAKSFFYFTKESHIYTLLNCILEGGLPTKIARRAIPELDYLSQICFELYESWDDASEKFSYSIRVSISPGCHTFDPLDVQLDSRHAIGCAPRRSLTPHQDWKKVTETLKAKFDTVKLPKSFIAVNLSDKHAAARQEEEEQESRQ